MLFSAYGYTDVDLVCDMIAHTCVFDAQTIRGLLYVTLQHSAGVRTQHEAQSWFCVVLQKNEHTYGHGVLLCWLSTFAMHQTTATILLHPQIAADKIQPPPPWKIY